MTEPNSGCQQILAWVRKELDRLTSLRRETTWSVQQEDRYLRLCETEQELLGILEPNEG